MMKRITKLGLGAAAIATVGGLFVGCDSTGPNESSDVEVQNHSVTPALVKNLALGIQAYSLIGSDDVLPGSPGFVFGGSADGMGLLRNVDGTFSVVVNNEDNFAVSRVDLDRTLKPMSGQYLLNSDEGIWRLCSATLTTTAEHGFGPIFLTNGESGEESMIHAVDPVSGTSRLLPALGHWSAENAVPLPKNAYAGKTVILIGDDDSGTYGGQVVLYVGNTVGDLDNGSLYVLARADNNMRERDMVLGQQYPVEFRKIDNQKQMSGLQLNQKSAELKSVMFGRVEDLDYRKGGNGREVYFNVTGQATSGANADYSRTKYGRAYRLTLNADDPTRGTLEVILDGDDRTGPARLFQNPDNIVATRNYVYIQEDPNGYGDETHDSYIYQYNIASKELKVVMELDHRRTAPDAEKYNRNSTGQAFQLSKFGDWEYGALIDVSEQTGLDDTFLLAIQPHTWRGDKYKNPDGGSKRTSENQASQLVVLTGLPR